MIFIFHNKINAPFPVKKWGFYFQQMPEDIKERIRRYRKEENKYQLLTGRLLLNEGMNQLGFKDFDLEDLHYNENNCQIWSNLIFFPVLRESLLEI